MWRRYLIPLLLLCASLFLLGSIPGEAAAQDREPAYSSAMGGIAGLDRGRSAQSDGGADFSGYRVTLAPLNGTRGPGADTAGRTYDLFVTPTALKAALLFDGGRAAAATTAAVGLPSRRPVARPLAEPVPLRRPRTYSIPAERVLGGVVITAEGGAATRPASRGGGVVKRPAVALGDVLALLRELLP